MHAPPALSPIAGGLSQGRDAGSVSRVPAPEIEALVIAALRSAVPASHDQSDAELIASCLKRVVVPTRSTSSSRRR